MVRIIENILPLYKVGLIILVLKTDFILMKSKGDDNVMSESEEKSMVKVRAVLINCQIEDGQNASVTDTSPFQREELFKHNALRDCNKKLALTLKLSSESDKNSDEYIPIDHVFEGSKKRFRLLNPYVLRLRWDPPLQAYKLRRLDRVDGILTDSDENLFEKTYKSSRVRRDYEHFSIMGKWPLNLSSTASLFTLEYDDRKGHGDTIEQSDLQEFSQTVTNVSTRESKDWTKREVCTEYENQSLVREKRQERNIMIERDIDIVPWSSSFQSYNLNQADVSGDTTHEHIAVSENLESPKKTHKPDIDTGSLSYKNLGKKRSKKNYNNFALYEIGHPDLWCNAHVQLFKKLNTPEGKTIWNDITKGETVSISSLSPEWTDQDINLRYRSIDRILKDEFILPFTSRLCLLVPLTSENTPVDTDKYIIVPIEDVAMAKNDNGFKRSDGNGSKFSSDPVYNKRIRRKVLVRLTRALLGSNVDKLNIVNQRTDRFLTMPHRKPHPVQIDLEVRADDNQLIIVGSSGRITTAVSDNTRRTRTVITVQATNTGLAAARYRLKTRDCGPDLSDDTMTGPVLLPPRQTRRISLELPMDTTQDLAYCSVALVNDKDDSVAVRDVAIRKGDRCFCVWHCDCVCLSEHDNH